MISTRSSRRFVADHRADCITYFDQNGADDVPCDGRGLAATAQSRSRHYADRWACTEDPGRICTPLTASATNLHASG